MLKKLFLPLFFCFFILQLSTPSYADSFTSESLEDVDDDLSLGGDIFNNFSEDLETSQVVEDERFYRYGRFFSFNIGVGVTRFDGNRSRAYQVNSDPSFNISWNFFFNFFSSFSLGFQYSRHTMFSDTVTAGHRSTPAGAIEITMLRPFFAFRYYMDTSNYGNALTYSNPYSVIRLEYWYQTNKFQERADLEDQSGGGIGIGLGFGLEFPIEIKQSYIGVEFLWHNVAFFDKFTKDYSAINVSDANTPTYEDLTGNAYSVFVTYNITW